ncbi:MAG: hypothetical protein BMS9Abin20_0943 [Acidimicrobiia bacterium]|nr:MAG: hypothetical protein BMS9Abin20_0943 [Acidimicrobiia bacterium]
MTEHDPYTRRLERVTGARWKQILDVQAPYRWNLQRLEPGYVLDIGCGIGRNLAHLEGNGVGVDTSRSSVEVARERGYVAYTADEFPSSRHANDTGFDSLLFAHVLEHMPDVDATDLVRCYLRYVRRGGKVIVIVPQEAGYASDETHVNFLDRDDVAAMLMTCGLRVDRSYSFPFPRAAGRIFRHNETVVVASMPQRSTGG